MVLENLGKGCVFVFILLAVSVSLEHDTPLFIIWSHFGKSICLSFDLLQGHTLCRLWVNAAKSLVVSFICSRAVHLKPLFELAICSYPFTPCRPSLCPKSNCHILCFTFKLSYSFCVIDGGYIKALLWRFLFHRLQLIIWNQDLEIT